MTLPLFIAIFAVNFVYIMLKAMQQKSVVADKKLFIVPTSMAMAACETFMVATIATMVIATQSYWAFVPAGLGGGVGCLIGMALFNKLNKESSQ
jgi:hypothetical protein